MIAFVKGRLESRLEDRVIIENGGIGYEIYVPGSVLDQLPHAGEEIKLHTYLHVREDVMQLYGFLTADALAFFKMLITVSGIGPKGALGILSVMDVDSLRFAILAGDSKSISRAPGIGKKTAEKVVLELRDKIDADAFLSDSISDSDMSLGGAGASAGSAATDAAKDAIEALIALGYSSTDAMRAVRAVATDDADTESILKLALKSI
ncbi:MAG: Holliday junction branch migration protein RuvA [Eubacterium sp.]|nr:Holliday junction branch migration protein RuvA [Eubacterium sp.]